MIMSRFATLQQPIQKLSCESSKISPPTALWLLQSLQAICLPPPGMFILDNPLGKGKMHGTCKTWALLGRRTKKRTNKKTDGNDDMWYMQNLGGEEPLQKKCFPRLPTRWVYEEPQPLVVGMVNSHFASAASFHPLIRANGSKSPKKVGSPLSSPRRPKAKSNYISHKKINGSYPK